MKFQEWVLNKYNQCPYKKINSKVTHVWRNTHILRRPEKVVIYKPISMPEENPTCQQLILAFKSL